MESGNLQWHYLTLTQLSYVHQLMGEQVISLKYLDQLEAVSGDVDPSGMAADQAQAV